MPNELSKKDESTIAILGTKDLGDLIKPLVKEIHLFDSFVAGTAMISNPAELENLEAGTWLSLMREENKFDTNTIVILTEAGKRIGYVPEKDNQIFARLMDAGKLLKAQISSIEATKAYTKIAIGIYLVDY